MFEAGKEYRTRDGRRARVYATDGMDGKTIHGAVHQRSTGWCQQAWRPGGKLSDKDHPLDLMPPVREWDMWVCPGRDTLLAPVYHMHDEELYGRGYKRIRVREVTPENE